MCKIDTKSKGPISWHRPIRNQEDKIKFQGMVDKLERKGIIENSQSM